VLLHVQQRNDAISDPHSCVCEYDQKHMDRLFSPQTMLSFLLFTSSVLYTYLDLEWKVLYVGSAHDKAKDQVLDEILVGPVPVGVNKFVLQADPPNPDSLPPTEILGVTVVLVTCSYKEREFVRVGYYVNNEYTVALAEGQSPPAYPALDMTAVQRQILADKPRVTKFPIPWGTTDEALAAAAAASASAGSGNIENLQGDTMEDELDDDELDDDDDDDNDDDDSEQDVNGTDKLAMTGTPTTMEMDVE
jgi:histone chaperone ASF1